MHRSNTICKVIPWTQPDGIGVVTTAGTDKQSMRGFAGCAAGADQYQGRHRERVRVGALMPTKEFLPTNTALPKVRTLEDFQLLSENEVIARLQASST